jgi:hypothetical protein
MTTYSPCARFRPGRTRTDVVTASAVSTTAGHRPPRQRFSRGSASCGRATRTKPRSAAGAARPEPVRGCPRHGGALLLKSPGNADLLLVKGQLQAFLGHHDAALETLALAAAIAPDYLDIRLMQARVQLFAEAPEAAMASCCPWSPVARARRCPAPARPCGPGRRRARDRQAGLRPRRRAGTG